MATIYTYSYSSDFGSNWDQSQFHDEIVASAIAQTLNGVTKTGDDIDVEFAVVLSAGDQTTLGNLVSVHAPITNAPGAIFDAIVDASGNGDYLLPSAAFANGHKSVFMKNGTYVETVDVVVPNYGSLVGESGHNTVIYFPAVAKSVKVDGSGGSQETAGTISITTGTTTITGVGTTFTNLAANDYILLGTNYFKIASITNATSMTLADTYRGATLSGISYVAQTMYTGNRLSNFIITGSTTNGLYIRGCRHFVVDSLAIKANSPNVLVEYSGDSTLKHLLSETGNGYGVKLDNCASLALNVVDVYNNTSHGLEVTGESTSVNLISCKASNNGGTGICIMGNSNDINLTDCVVKFNKANGLVTESTTHAIMVDSTSIRGNASKGLYIDGGGHTITGNIIEENGDIGLDVISGDCSLIGNVIDGNTNGIKLTGNCITMSNNHCVNNSLAGILVMGNDCILTSNISTSNTQEGVKIETGATDTIVSLNNVKGNAGTNLVDNGTNTTSVNNKS